MNTPLWTKLRFTTPETVLKHTDQYGATVDILEVAEQLGVPIYRVRVGDQVSWQAALRDSSTRAEIFLNDKITISLDQEILIARLIGHLILHPLGRVYRLSMGQAAQSLEDIEAMRFGAEILMSPSTVRRVYGF